VAARYINEKVNYIIKMKINEDIAEFYGALIGDGCLSRYYSNYDKRNCQILLFTGHTHDAPYYKERLQPILIKEFEKKGYIQFRKDYNVVRFETKSKDVFNFFEKLGFPVGLKGNLSIPKVIFNNKSLSLASIRGIFDTDGSIYKRYSKKYKNHSKKYNYKNIQFKMNSSNVIYQIKNILDRIEIQTSNIRKDGNSYVLTIHNQKSIKKFFEIVKPSNPYHTERFLKKD
jgi:hypothetical protein